MSLESLCVFVDPMIQGTENRGLEFAFEKTLLENQRNELKNLNLDAGK